MEARNKASKCEQINEYLVCKHNFVAEKLIEGEICLKRTRCLYHTIILLTLNINHSEEHPKQETATERKPKQKRREKKNNNKSSIFNDVEFIGWFCRDTERLREHEFRLITMCTTVSTVQANEQSK